MEVSYDKVQDRAEPSPNTGTVNHLVKSRLSHTEATMARKSGRTITEDLCFTANYMREHQNPRGALGM